MPNHAKLEEIAGGIGVLKRLHHDHGTKYSGEVVVDLFMRLDESVRAAEAAFPKVLKDSLGAELSQRNLVGTTDDLISRVAKYADAGATAMDLKPIYHSVPALMTMMERFAAEVMPATA